MATEIIKRLSTRATEAEQMIQFLKKQIESIKVAQGSSNGSSSMDKEIQLLRRENSQLKAQVSDWKNKLIAAENASGVKQITTAASVPPSTSTVEIKKPSPEKEMPAKKEKPKKEKKEDKKPATSDGGGNDVHVGRLDMRVGLIKTAKRHPDADSLYVEEVDVGEEKCRTVISGLVKFIPEEDMQNRKAILMCNLKPSKMRGIMSEAMVMCASTPEKVEILSPPEDSKPGDLVFVEGFERNPDAQLNPKKKIFEACAPDLKVNDEKIATYKDIPWSVNGKPCKSQTLTYVQVK